MKQEDLMYALTDIRADFIEEAAHVRRRPARRVLMAAVAASLALLLMGAGIIYGDSIQSWMDRRWSWENGQAMSGEQAELVEAMSQDLGMSKTVGGITVDVDSAIFGDRGFRILLRVRGRQFVQSECVSFDRWAMEMEPDPTAGMGHGRGWEFAGIDGDGSLLLFFHCFWDQAHRPEAPFTVRLSMTDLLLTGPGGVTEEVLQAGSWEFEFPLEVTGVPEPIALPNCTVIGHDPDTGEKVELELKNVVLYSTGLSYEKTGDGEFEVTVMLDDGSSIAATLGIGDTRWWDVPVDPARVRELRIGETTIQVPRG